MGDWPLLTHGHADSGDGGELSLYGALAQAETWAGLQTFNAGLKIAATQAIVDSGDTPRIYVSAVAPHVLLSAYTRIGDWDSGLGTGTLGRLGINANPSYAVLCSVVHEGGDMPWSNVFLQVGTPALPPIVTGSNKTIIIFKGAPTINFAAATTGGILDGMLFAPAAVLLDATTAVTRVSALRAAPSISSTSAAATLAKMVGLDLVAPIAATPCVIDTLVGVDIADYGSAYAANSYGLRIANITASTSIRRLIEALGLTTANLRVEAGDPAANQSQALIAINNGAVVSRRIEVGVADSAGAGYRTLRVAN